MEIKRYGYIYYKGKLKYKFDLYHPKTKEGRSDRMYIEFVDILSGKFKVIFQEEAEKYEVIYGNV